MLSVVESTESTVKTLPLGQAAAVAARQPLVRENIDGGGIAGFNIDHTQLQLVVGLADQLIDIVSYFVVIHFNIADIKVRYTLR